MNHKARFSAIDDGPVEAALAEYFDRQDRGERIVLTEIIAAHPGCETGLRQFLEQERKLHAVAVASLTTAPHESLVGRKLGDFLLRRELGRGGMGAVFEADQLSMGRQVALKVLPLAALVHDKSLQRFRNEVRAAAALDHPHIVSVYSVGEDRGVHYYAMQLIRGQSLADLISELRRNRRASSPLPKGEGLNGADAPTIDSAVNGLPATKSDEQARISTVVDSHPSAEHYRAAARLGIQAAEALQHAHDQGVLHRDIKPGNLMLDADGKLYITDFGLARIEADAGMTMTGDILGTLRYMAPEQALAKRVVIDHRADVYSLGASLYELLTLQPVFGETDRSELLKQIAFEEPRPLRKLDRRTPAELETIVLKAMAKQPDERYQSAQRLADDLRAFLENRPIEAKPPTLLNRAGKWSRRHVGVVWTALAASLIGVAVLAVSTALIADSRQAANADRERAEADRNDAVSQRGEARRNQYYAEIVSGQANLAQGNFQRLEQKLIRHLPLGDEPDRRGWEWYYLFSFCHPEQRTLYYPSFRLFAAWSPDGEYIATSGTIWEADSGECVRRLWAYGDEGVAWSPDGQKFAWGTTADDSCIYIWNRQTDNVSELRGHASSVWCVAFSPDGTQLASASIDKTVKIWDLATGTVVQTLEIGDNVSDVAWSPDGELLALGESLQIWSVATGKRVALRKELDELCGRVSWRPDGRQLAVNTSGHWYILQRPDWDLVLEHNHSSIGTSDSAAGDIEWNPAGTQLAIAQDTVVTVWDPVLDQSITKLAGHTDLVKSVGWSPDGRRLVTTDSQCEIRNWDLDSPLQPPVISTGAPLQSLTWELDSNTLVSVDASNMTSSFWRVTDGAKIKEMPTHAVDHVVERGGVLSPDRRLTAQWTRSDDRLAITVRDAKTGAVHSIWHSEESFEPLSFAWSQDGSKLAISTASGTEWRLEVWDSDHGRQISRWTRCKFDKGYNRLEIPTWSPDCTRVAVVGFGDLGDDGSRSSSHVHIIDVASGRRVFKWGLGESRPGGWIKSLAWSADGHFLAFGTSEGLTSIIDPESETVAMSVKAGDSAISALDWSPDGQRLAVAAADGVVKVIESQNGNELLSLCVAGHGLCAGCLESGRSAAGSRIRRWRNSSVGCQTRIRIRRERQSPQRTGVGLPGTGRRQCRGSHRYGGATEVSGAGSADLGLSFNAGQYIGPSGAVR